MDRYNEARKNYLRDGNLFNQTDPEDIELAYQLEHTQPNDIETMQRLIYRSAGVIYLWVDVLLTYYRNARPDKLEILDIIGEIFSQAAQKVDQFHGQASVLNWLLEISYPIIRRRKHRIQPSKGAVQQVDYDGRLIDKDPQNLDFWQNLNNLPEKHFLPIFLRYLFDLNVAEIARIFNIRVKDAHTRLIKGRSRFMHNSIKSHKDQQIQAYFDCIMDGDLKELQELEAHILECNQCQMAITQLKEAEIFITSRLRDKWILPDLDADTMERLIQSIVNKQTQTKHVSKIQTVFHHSTWLVGFSVIFIVFAVIFIRMTPVEREFAAPKPTATQVLPAIVEMQPRFDSPPKSNDQFIAPRYVEPDFSTDGNWIVYSTILADPNSGLLKLPTIELLDRSSNTTKVIHNSNGTLNSMLSGWDLAPSISADGSWIVYAGSAISDTAIETTCSTSSIYSCIDIFLYNRVNDITKQISQAWDGEAANGISLSPTISGDGKWIAFWSIATNLVKGEELICPQGSGFNNCLFVYLYNQETGTIKRIPVSTTYGNNGVATGPISLSYDGRYVGFTISIQGQAGNPTKSNEVNYDILGSIVSRAQHFRSYDYFDFTTEAIVYDQVTGQAEIENLAPDGSIGNGPSSSPMLSADGRYVAFASGSSDLVEGDNNDATDVFVRDRTNGHTELVSINTAGEQGDGDSGQTQWGKGYNGINISADGRYVIFESTAANLGQRMSFDCYYYQASNCILLYVRDRQTKHTELINSLPYGDYLRYPGISSDGNWISFMQSKYRCGTSQGFCSNLMLYDHRSNIVSSLTNFGDAFPNLSWSFAGGTIIPWELWESKALAFSADGYQLAIGGMDSKIRIYQVKDSKDSLISTDPTQEIDSGKRDTFSKITFSPNGRWLTAGTNTGNVYIWKLPEGVLIYSLQENQETIKDLIFANHCTQLIITSADTTSIWQIQKNFIIRKFNYTYNTAVDVSPTGSMLALDGGNGFVFLKSLPEGNIIGRLSNGQGSIRDLAFSEDGSLLAVSLDGGVINIWQIQKSGPDQYSYTPKNSFKSVNVNGTLSFSPDNLYLTSSGTYGELVVWGLEDGKLYGLETSFPNSMVNSLAFSKGSDYLAIVLEDNVSLWKMTQAKSGIYFQQSQKNDFIDSTPLPEASADDIHQTSMSAQTQPYWQVDLAELNSILQFPFLIPTRLPDSLSFNNARFYQDGSLCLQYDISFQKQVYSSLYICEWSMDNSSKLMMTVGTDAQILPVQITTASGQTEGEFVQGDWVLSQSYTLPTSEASNGIGHEYWKWDNTLTSQRLRWEQNGILIALYYRVGNSYSTVLPNPGNGGGLFPEHAYLTPADLAQIASDLEQISGVGTIESMTLAWQGYIDK